jgi:hypothetical protein
MEQKEIKAKLVMMKDKRISIRLYLTPQEREHFILELGEQPKDLFRVFIYEEF